MSCYWARWGVRECDRDRPILAHRCYPSCLIEGDLQARHAGDDCTNPRKFNVIYSLLAMYATLLLKKSRRSSFSLMMKNHCQGDFLKKSWKLAKSAREVPPKMAQAICCPSGPSAVALFRTRRPRRTCVTVTSAALEAENRRRPGPRLQ